VLRVVANLGPRPVPHEGPAAAWGRQIYPIEPSPAAWKELSPWSVRWYLTEVSR